MIYVSQLNDGRHHVQTTTGAPHREVYAVNALPSQAYEDAADARQAQRFAAEWAERNRWKIMATDRATGEDFECFTFAGCPTVGIARARASAVDFGRDCFGFHAIPA